MNNVSTAAKNTHRCKKNSICFMIMLFLTCKLPLRRIWLWMPSRMRKTVRSAGYCAVLLSYNHIICIYIYIQTFTASTCPKNAAHPIWVGKQKKLLKIEDLEHPIESFSRKTHLSWTMRDPHWGTLAHDLRWSACEDLSFGLPPFPRLFSAQWQQAAATPIWHL